MNDQIIERKMKALRDIKQFARAEMARDLGRRHGKSLRLPWDPTEEPQQEAQPVQEQIDSEALDALAGLAGGN